MAEPKKQAPKAKETYTNGTMTTYSRKQDGPLVNR